MLQVRLPSGLPVPQQCTIPQQTSCSPAVSLSLLINYSSQLCTLQKPPKEYRIEHFLLLYRYRPVFLIRNPQMSRPDTNYNQHTSPITCGSKRTNPSTHLHAQLRVSWLHHGFGFKLQVRTSNTSCPVSLTREIWKWKISRTAWQYKARYRVSDSNPFPMSLILKCLTKSDETITSNKRLAVLSLKWPIRHPMIQACIGLSTRPTQSKAKAMLNSNNLDDEISVPTIIGSSLSFLATSTAIASVLHDPSPATATFRPCSDSRSSHYISQHTYFKQAFQLRENTEGLAFRGWEANTNPSICSSKVTSPHNTSGSIMQFNHIIFVQTDTSFTKGNVKAQIVAPGPKYQDNFARVHTQRLSEKKHAAPINLSRKSSSINVFYLT